MNPRRQTASLLLYRDTPDAYRSHRRWFGEPAPGHPITQRQSPPGPAGNLAFDNAV